MSTLDLYAADFPHGTPRGYELGCRSHAACPTSIDLLLSCATAWQKNAGDYTVAKLYAAGATPAEVSAYLHPAGPRATLNKLIAGKNPAASATGIAALHQDTATAIAVDERPEDIAVPKAQDLDQFREETDKRTGPTRASVIRAWARENGHDVPRTGPLQNAIIRAYEAAHAADVCLDETPTGDDWHGAIARAYDDTPPATDSTPAAPSDVSEALAAGSPVPPRPTWGEVNAFGAMERARTTAVRLEQELAHTQDLLAAETRRADTAERAVLVLLDHWEAANQTIDRLHRELDQTDDDIAAFEQYVRNTFRPAGALANEQDDAWSYPAQHAAPQPGPRPSTWRRVLTFLGLAD